MAIRISGALLLALVLSGCLTMSGRYLLVPLDENGHNLRPEVIFIAEGLKIYQTRDVLCDNFPAAIIRIFNIDSRTELASESPYHCSTRSLGKE